MACDERLRRHHGTDDGTHSSHLRSSAFICGFNVFCSKVRDLPIPGGTGYSRIMSSGDHISILRLSALSALALGLLLRLAR
jgi:hypothetical protein